MSQLDALSGEPSARFDPQSLLTTPIGLSTPLFLAIYSAASVGAAFWWMSQLTRYTHLETKLARADVAPEPIVILACEPEIEPEPVFEPEPEPVAEPEPEVPIEIQEPIAEPIVSAQTLAASPEVVFEAPAKPKPAPKPRVSKAKTKT